MPERFFIGDLHLGHRKLVAPCPETGETIRPWSSREEMNETLISNWNGRVGPKDKVFLLGDALLNRSAMPLLGRLNGLITVVMGNHDTMRAEEYLAYVKDLKGAVEYNGWILTHIPVHSSQLSRFSANVHGHLHDKGVEEPGYLCVSAEQTDYRPLSHEEVEERLRRVEEKYGRRVV